MLIPVHVTSYTQLTATLPILVAHTDSLSTLNWQLSYLRVVGGLTCM